MYESLANDKNIEMCFNGLSLDGKDAVNKLECWFDQEKMQKIITNLISNAIKFTPNGGIIEVENFSADNMVTIKVSNSGERIPPEKLPHLFDRFYQADTNSTRAYEGTGIGLALVKELTSLHHGTVKVESSIDRTTFTVSIPQSDEYLQENEKLTSSTPFVDDIIISDSIEKIQPDLENYQITDFTENDQVDKLEVLIVEDNADLRTYIRSILESRYTVSEAVDGVDGLEKAEKQIPDLIVSDVMMPNMDGYELCSKLKSNIKTNHIPIVLLTAKASRENKLEGLEQGADDYLVKPFDEEELSIKIKNLINIREQLQKKYSDESWVKPKAIKVDSVQQKFMRQVKEALEKNMDNDQFSVEDLGAEIAMSRSQVHRKLKALTNHSATAFIRHYRLHRAAELLKQESGTITEIAYQVGFSSQTYFSSSFQELFGCSPSEFMGRE